MAGQVRAAFDSVSQGIGAFSADGRLVRWNERFAGLLGLPDAMMRPGTAYEALAEQLAAEGVALLKTERQIGRRIDGLVPGEPVVHEFTRAADGRSFEVCRTTMPGGGYVLTVTDTTERVRADAAARDAQRLQAMGQLTGGIAHDFNNLLTVVLGNLEMATAMLEANSPAVSRLDRAIWAAHRGASLTQQLLAFARKQPLAPMPINLSALLPDMAELLRRTLGEDIEIRMLDAARLWTAMADPAQVESALLNLALNARDALPGGGRLTIEVANKVLDARRPSAPACRGDTRRLRDAGRCGHRHRHDARCAGAGLRAVLHHQGARQGDGPRPGHGVRIRQAVGRACEYPLGARQGHDGEALPSARHRDRAAPATPRAAAPVALPRGSATILVVEDDDSVREVAVAILRDLGYRVLAAADGAEALRVFDENGGMVDLLLVDVVLPGGMKGDEVARRLAEMGPGLRTLFMSGYTEDPVVHHDGRDDGAQLIWKPFQREQLARKVARMLGTMRTDASQAREDAHALQPHQPV